MLKAQTRKDDKVLEVLLGDAPEHVIMSAEVFVKDNQLLVVDTESKTTVLSQELPGPVEVVRDARGEVQEWNGDGDIPFSEFAFNPVVEKDGVIRAAQSISLKPDNLKHALINMAKVQLLSEEMSRDRDVLEHVDWAVRVYRVFCRAVPLDEKPRPERKGIDGDGNEVIVPGHNGLVGCVVYHNVGFIAGNNA